MDFLSLLWYVVCYPTERSIKMIDRRTKAEIFRDTERQYESDPTSLHAYSIK